MCLFKRGQLSIAEKNITTYKVIRSDLKSQYYSFQYELNKLYSKIWDKSFIRYCNKKTEVGGNAFHSCLSKERAMYLYGEKSKRVLLPDNSFEYHTELNESQIVVRCIIPAGSKYFKGTNQEVASENIIIKEICH